MVCRHRRIGRHANGDVWSESERCAVANRHVYEVRKKFRQPLTAGLQRGSSSQTRGEIHLLKRKLVGVSTALVCCFPFLLFIIIFRGRVRVTIVMKKGIGIRVWPKLGSWAEIWPKFRPQLG